MSKIICKVTEDERKEIANIVEAQQSIQQLIDDLIQRHMKAEEKANMWWSNIRWKYNIESKLATAVDTKTGQITEALQESEK